MTKTHVEAVAPTCNNAGSDAVVMCSGCLHTEGGGTVAAIGHSMKQTATEIPATCGATGKTAVYTCVNGCGKTEGGDAIPATGEHVYKNWADNGNGTHTGTCVCGETSTADHGYDLAYEHQFIGTSTWTVHSAAQHKRICKDCSYVNYSTHSYTKNYVVTPKVEATCTSTGSEAVVMCNVCAHADGGETIPMASHNFASGVCSACGTAEFSLGDVDNDGRVALADVILTLNAFINSRTIDNADMNGDGELSFIDVLRVLKAATA